jgi:ketosteroid isomerase-like protein
METLWAFEQAGWEALSGAPPGPRAFYDQVLTDDAVMIVPGMVLGRAAVLESWDGVPPWTEHQLADPRVIVLGSDAAALLYAATARRDGQAEDYRAAMTSVYVRGTSGWQLAIHQQTPLD